uniref:Uncharacterized protein n=1 Tax=Oryza nivara TaxID=4536 RepID=A0A0E0IIF9_ORYNI
MSPSDQALLFVCLRRVLLLSVALSAVAGQNIAEVGGGIDDDVLSHRKVIMISSVVTEVVADEVQGAITELVGGGGVHSVRTITEVDGGDVVRHRKVHSITEEDGRADDDDEVHAITNESVGADGKLSSASQVLYPARADANTAAADRLIATTMIVMLMVVTSERKKRSGRATWFSPAAVLTMLLLVVAASANSSAAARPLPTAAAAGHNEAAVAAVASETMPVKAAAPGHSSCTTDPNTQQPVRCIPH